MLMASTAMILAIQTFVSARSSLEHVVLNVSGSGAVVLESGHLQAHAGGGFDSTTHVELNESSVPSGTAFLEPGHSQLQVGSGFNSMQHVEFDMSNVTNLSHPPEGPNLTLHTPVQQEFVEEQNLKSGHVLVQASAETSRIAAKAFLIFTVMLSLGVVFALWRRGLLPIFAVLLYIASLFMVKFSVKHVLADQDYHFPLLLTATQYGTCSIVVIILFCFRRLLYGTPFPVPSCHQFLFAIIPMATGSIAIGMDNLALMYSSLAFVEVVGSATPIVTFSIQILLGKPVHLICLLPVTVATLGAFISSSVDQNFVVVGGLLAFGAIFGRASKASMQQELLKSGLEPIIVLAWTQIPGFMVTATWSALVEGVKPWHCLAADPESRVDIICAIALSCVSAGLMNCIALFVIRELGAVCTQLIGQAKGVLIILGGIAIFREPFTLVQCFGFAAVMCGVLSYMEMDRRLDAADKEELKLKQIEGHRRSRYRLNLSEHTV